MNKIGENERNKLNIGCLRLDKAIQKPHCHYEFITRDILVSQYGRILAEIADRSWNEFSF